MATAAWGPMWGGLLRLMPQEAREVTQGCGDLLLVTRRYAVVLLLVTHKDALVPLLVNHRGAVVSLVVAQGMA